MTGPRPCHPRDVPGAQGSVLVELLVATACMSLVAAAVLPLLVGTTRVERDRLEAAAARGAADRAADLLLRDLRRAGQGLEGAWAVERGGTIVPVVLPGSAGVDLVLARGPALEADSLGGVTGPFRVLPSGVPAPGTPVAGLGSPGRPPGTAVPVGRVTSVDTTGSLPVVRVAWSAGAAATLAAWGAPRALAAVEFTSWTLQAGGAGGARLRRRVEGGAWQPVLTEVASLALDYGLDRDGDGRVDAPVGPAVPAGDEGWIRVVRATLVRREAGGGLATARGWIRREIRP